MSGALSLSKGSTTHSSGSGQAWQPVTRPGSPSESVKGFLAPVNRHSDRVYPDENRERNLRFSRLRSDANQVNLRSLCCSRDDGVSASGRRRCSKVLPGPWIIGEGRFTDTRKVGSGSNKGGSTCLADVNTICGHVPYPIRIRSVANLIRSCRSRPTMNRAIVRGPNLPTNIVIATTTCAG